MQFPFVSLLAMAVSLANGAAVVNSDPTALGATTSCCFTTLGGPGGPVLPCLGNTGSCLAVPTSLLPHVPTVEPPKVTSEVSMITGPQATATGSVIPPAAVAAAPPVGNVHDAITNATQIVGATLSTMYCQEQSLVCQPIQSLLPHMDCFDTLCELYGTGEVPNAWTWLFNGFCPSGPIGAPSTGDELPQFIDNSLAWLFTIYLQAAAGSWNTSGSDWQFIQFNSMLCQSLSSSSIAEMGMKNTIVMDSVCNSAGAGGSHSETVTEVKEGGVIDAAASRFMKTARSLVFAWNYVILRQAVIIDQGIEVFPAFRCESRGSFYDPLAHGDHNTTEYSLVNAGLDAMAISKVACAQQSNSSTILLATAKTEIRKHTTDYFVAQSVAALRNDRKLSALWFFCSSADAESLSAFGLDGDRAVQAWCEAFNSDGSNTATPMMSATPGGPVQSQHSLVG
ncbi:hypothetical protein K490DRAFT_64544 [Saccharata proteae CBS 121410]|uniref:Glycoside hydrolase family 76 protein n=1 Tax=Saccharata proteae CBS 121410 TaxID=1314787 RepID=A0A9P4HUW4_9PEZI|nr:hypothetical protein K490DRAFT_64544 [Saccharata proteae CBS 121410]